MSDGKLAPLAATSSTLIRSNYTNHYESNVVLREWPDLISSHQDTNGTEGLRTTLLTRGTMVMLELNETGNEGSLGNGRIKRKYENITIIFKGNILRIHIHILITNSIKMLVY